MRMGIVVLLAFGILAVVGTYVAVEYRRSMPTPEEWARGIRGPINRRAK